MHPGVRWLSFLLAIFFVCFWRIPNSQAYLTFLESGEILSSDLRRASVVPQLLSNMGSGGNLDFAYDHPWNESMSSRFMVGTGTTDIHLGGSFKWVPIPDVQRQPALGLRGSLWFARYDDENFLTQTIAPFLSKKYESDVGMWIPYLASPLNFTLNRNKNSFGQQFIVGTEFLRPEWKDLHLAGEISFNFKDSASFFAFLVGWTFDGRKGLPFKK